MASLLASLPVAAILFLVLLLHHAQFQVIVATSNEISSSSNDNTAPTPTPSPVTQVDTRPARALLAFDKVVSGPLVAGMNVSVTYVIHNVGQHPASDISLRDSSYPSSRFEVSAPARNNWRSLAAGQTVTYSISLQPKRAGQLYVTPPTVTYTDDAEDGVKHTARLARTRRGEGGSGSRGRGDEYYGDEDGFGDEDEEGRRRRKGGKGEMDESEWDDNDDAAVVVQDLVEYRRKNEKHEKAWLMYVGACVLLSAAPFAVADRMTRKLSVKAVAGSKKSS